MIKMSTREILQQVLDIMDEIMNIVDNTNWRDYSEVRTKILITRKTDDLKHILGEIPDDDLMSSEEASNFFEKILDKITRILGSLPQDKMPLQWYELELWRLRYASMYALQWGHAGELQVAGTAHALANVLMGIQTMDVQNLIVEWEHPEFEKRRKLILNYLSSAFLFFFSLCTSLNLIFKHDLEHWLSEGIKASEQYLKYMDKFWNVPKNIDLQKKKHRNVRDPNYSPYYATFAGIDYILSFLLDLQRYFFRENVIIDTPKEIIDISSPEKYFDTLHKLLDNADYYVSDFKKHVKEGFFDINEEPLNYSDVKETIYELEVTKIWVKGLYAIYQLVNKDEKTELKILEKEEYIKSCIRGLIDTDGCIYALKPHYPNYYQLCFKNYNITLLRDFRKDFLKLGYPISNILIKRVICLINQTLLTAKWLMQLIQFYQMLCYSQESKLLDSIMKQISRRLIEIMRFSLNKMG